MRWRFLAIGMYILGAIAAEATLLVSGNSGQPVWAAHAAAGVFSGLGVVAWFATLRTYRLAVFVNVVGSIAVVTALIVVARRIQGIEVFYLWPMLGAAYLLRRLEVVLIGVLAALAYAAALVLSPTPGPFPGLHYALFILASTVVVISVRMLAENLQRLIRALHTSSATDPLTGVLNRRSFDRRFGVSLDQATREGVPLSVLLLDLDNFKRVNDRHGHEVGDRALVRFSQLLEAQSRAGDLVARVGGEEFAVVLVGATLDQAVQRAEQFADIIRKDRAIEGLALTVSIGVSTQESVDDTPSVLLRRADAAVYRAKREGRDRVVVADAARAEPDLAELAS